MEHYIFKQEPQKARISFMCSGWTLEEISKPGRYTFTFTPDHSTLKPDTDGWFDTKHPPLTYQFVVESAKPVAMEARWETCGTNVLVVRVGEKVSSSIILQLLDDEGKQVSA